MIKLKFSDDFKNIIEDIPYWKTEEDIPKTIITFIKETSNNIVIYDKSTKQYHCSKCLTSLDTNYFCTKCRKNYHQEIQRKKYLKEVNKVKYYYNDYCNLFLDFYAFDIIDNHIILYLLTENITYENIFSMKIIKHSKIEITNIYKVEKDGITDITENKYHPFNYNDSNILENENATQKEIDNYLKEDNFFWTTSAQTLYQKNLNLLKPTIYKYSSLESYGSYLNENMNYIYLAQLTYIPIYCKQFEYLLKFKLYNLAFFHANEFKKGKNFKEIFGIDKKYLPFMQKNDITYNQLSALRLCQSENMELINFISNDIYIFSKLVNTYNINLTKLKIYFDKNKFNDEHFYEYYDYLEMAKKLELNLKDKNILFPKDLLLEHDKLYLQIQINNNPEIDKNINDFSKILALNYYEDERYIIIPATSLKDLIDESNQQNNCVRTYCEKIAKHQCQIYFMRKKEEISKSFITIEVRNKKIVQAKTKYNKLPDKEIMEVLHNWEKDLLPIITSKY